MKINLVEVFRSIQGEGYNAGRQAIFVRLSGCNLSCVFADGAVCDTPYQQTKITAPNVRSLFFDHILPLTDDPEMETVPPTEIPPNAKRERRDQLPMLVLTGGEPTLAPAFDDIVQQGYRSGFYVAVETNGTRWRQGLYWADWVTVSPKDDVTQGSPGVYHNPNPLKPDLHPGVTLHMEQMAEIAGEYRYVIGSDTEPIPTYLPAFRHYVSPAALSDGEGLEWMNGFRGFVPGTVQRCAQIVQEDSRWQISIQQHKLWGVR